MKKMVLGLSLAFVALVLIASSGWAETGPRPAARPLSVADQAFLASLAVKPVAKAPARPSGSQEKALCAAAASCGSYSISCSGNNSTTSCSASDRNCNIGERGHVTCDGVTTWCNEPCFDCNQLEWQCSWSCSPCNYNFSCDESTGDWDCRCIFRNCPV